MTNKAYEYEQWARAWDSLPVGERMPQAGNTVVFDDWTVAICGVEATKGYLAAVFQHPERIQIDRITVEE